MAYILVVDDEVGIRELLSEILGDEGHNVAQADSAAAATRLRAQRRPDLVLLDIWMQDADGISLLKDWAATGQLTMPVIMMSGHGSIETAVEAVRLGALEFLEKPISLHKLLAAVRRALMLPERSDGSRINMTRLGRGHAMQDFRRRLHQFAAASGHLLIKGAAGTPLELAARSLLAPNGAWLEFGLQSAQALVEAIEQSSTGIVYVADISTLSPLQQRQLAFVLERLARSKLRLVSATTAEPARLLEAGFDPGLLQLIGGVSITMPSLSEHAGDIPEFATFLLNDLIDRGEVSPRKFSTAALNVLRTRPWPGNHKQLADAIKALALNTLQEEIGTADIDRVLDQQLSEVSVGSFSLDLPLRQAREAFEAAYFRHHLRKEAGNIARVAEKTGLERTNLYRKLKQLGIQPAKRGQ